MMLQACQNVAKFERTVQGTEERVTMVGGESRSEYIRRGSPGGVVVARVVTRSNGESLRWILR